MQVKLLLQKFKDYIYNQLHFIIIDLFTISLD
jgi:hypothetical protein